VDCYCYCLRGRYSYAPRVQKVTARGAVFCPSDAMWKDIAEHYFASSLPVFPPTSYNLADENYRTALATPVNQFGLTGINTHLRNMISAFGWSSLALILLSAMGLATVAVTEYTLQTTQEEITRKAEQFGSGATGAKAYAADVREWKNAVSSGGVV